MKSHNDRVKKEMKSKTFCKEYEIEKRRVEIACRIAELREKKDLTQAELARKAHITQQQLSKIENAKNCNIDLLFKVCIALDTNLEMVSEDGRWGRCLTS
ncbi:MAG: helix-turn-helix transcriptional regulator [bacterium]